MNPTFVNSLWITLLSMGLVFSALVLLAGLMSAMTRLFRDRAESFLLSPSQSAPAGLPSDPGTGSEGEKARAAALAVAIALAQQAQSTARPIVPPPPAIIGAWQLGMRTRQMTKKGEMSRRGKG